MPFFLYFAMLSPVQNHVVLMWDGFEIWVPITSYTHVFVCWSAEFDVQLKQSHELYISKKLWACGNGLLKYSVETRSFLIPPLKIFCNKNMQFAAMCQTITCASLVHHKHMATMLHHGYTHWSISLFKVCEFSFSLCVRACACMCVCSSQISSQSAKTLSQNWASRTKPEYVYARHTHVCLHVCVLECVCARLKSSISTLKCTWL